MGLEGAARASFRVLRPFLFRTMQDMGLFGVRVLLSL